MTWSTEGSATFVAGSKVVSGNNTNWDPAHILPGDAIQASDGTIEEILTVNSATEMTLARNFRGESQTNGFFQVLPTRHLGVTLREKVQSLINLVQGDIQPTLDGFQVSFDALIQGYNQIIEGWDLSPIDAVLNGTAVDICIDASPLPSLGVQKACSWYNEPLNTATRGARREMPSVRVVVAEVDKVTIYDGDDASLPMWMVFEKNTRNFIPSYQGHSSVSSVGAINGLLLIGLNAGDGLCIVDFAKDNGECKSKTRDINWNRPVSERNSNSVTEVLTTPGSLPSDLVNDVAITVEDDAPVDEQTGLKVPTIAAATDNGISVIKNDGSVVSGGVANSGWKTRLVFFDVANNIWTNSINDPGYGGLQFIAAPPFNSVGSIGVGSAGYSKISNVSHVHGVTEGWPFLNDGMPVTTLSAGSILVSAASTGEGGLSLIQDSPADRAQSLAAYITSDYNTGWMVGDTKLAALCETDDADLVGGSVSDRSVSGNDLNAVGNITVSPVATGAELVAYSGFSSSNYIEQPYNADLDFGTGDFCVMGWLIDAGTGLGRVANRVAGGAGWNLYCNGGLLTLYDHGNGLTVLTSTRNISGGAHHFALLRLNGVLHLAIDGDLDVQAASVQNYTTTTAALRLGLDVSGVHPLSGSLSLLKISATVPSPDQIQKIYQDEKRMFQPGAKVTLGADAVTALAHDEITEILHVGHAAGRDEFSGLVNIGGSATPVLKTIAAHDGLIIEE